MHARTRLRRLELGPRRSLSDNGHAPLLAWVGILCLGILGLGILGHGVSGGLEFAAHSTEGQPEIVCRLFAFSIAALLVLPAASARRSAPRSRSKGSYLVFVGTYTGPVSKGIYAYRFNPGTGQAISLGLVAETANPSFLAIDPNRRFLYAVNEISEYQGQRSGSVSAFAIDQRSGRLALLNRVASRGDGPCYVSLDKTGKYVLVTNYGSGSIAVFPVLDDGRLGEATTVIQHSGHGPDRQRQEGPHPHQIDLSADNRFAIVTDLGLDQLLVYPFDPAKGTLAASQPPYAKVAPGAGPRHFSFAPHADFLYVINELQSNVSQYSYETAAGKVQQLATVSALPEGFRGTSYAAEIAMDPEGKFLYASNHGHDSIAIFAIDSAAGTPRFLEAVSTGGKTPRHFEIAPGGTYLFAANQESNQIVVFKIDKSTGQLTPSGLVLDVPSPACVKFVRVE
jgi:6-phosphogluconolactonase